MKKFIVTFLLFLCLTSQAIAQEFIVVKGVDYDGVSELYVIKFTNIHRSNVFCSNKVFSNKTKEFIQQYPYYVHISIVEFTDSDIRIFMTEEQLKEFLKQIEEKK